MCLRMNFQPFINGKSLEKKKLSTKFSVPYIHNFHMYWNQHVWAAPITIVHSIKFQNNSWHTGYMILNSLQKMYLTQWKSNCRAWSAKQTLDKLHFRGQPVSIITVLQREVHSYLIICHCLCQFYPWRSAGLNTLYPSSSPNWHTVFLHTTLPVNQPWKTIVTKNNSSLSLVIVSGT